MLLDNESFNFWVLPNTYRIIKIGEDIQYIKIFGNNRLYNEFDLKNEITLKNIRENTHISKLNLNID